MTTPRVPRTTPFNAKQPSKIGSVAGITERTVARGEALSVNPSQGGETRAMLQTYFTRGPLVGEENPLLYNGDRTWAKITLTLQTAGPVAIGTSSNISPVLSGKGVLLQTGIPISLNIAKGTRLYIASTGVNRVLFLTEPLPWLEQITANLGQLVSRIMAIATGK